MQNDIKLELSIKAKESLSLVLDELQNKYDDKTEFNKKSQILQNLSNTIKQMEIDIRVASQYYQDTSENKRLITVS